MILVLGCRTDVPYVPGEADPSEPPSATWFDTGPPPESPPAGVDWLVWGCVDPSTSVGEVWYSFGLGGVRVLRAEAVMVLDCSECSNPRAPMPIIEDHPIPFTGDSAFSTYLEVGPYDPGVSTTVGCITDLDDVAWTVGFRTRIDGHTDTEGDIYELVCWQFVEHGDGDGTDQHLGPDWGCVDWPYETGGVE